MNDRRARLRLQMFDQRRGQPDRAKQVRVENLARHGIIDPARRIVERHDPRIVDQYVQRRVVADQLRGNAVDVGRIRDVQGDALDPRMGGGHFIQQGLTAPGDDDLVTQGMKLFGKRAANARGAARDKDCVARHLHDLSLCCAWMAPSMDVLCAGRVKSQMP
ncbi:hypothetical protein D3C87_1311230 [compost metagenome]